MTGSEMSLLPVAPATKFADVCYRGIPRLIACAVLETDVGLLLVDPGPTVSLESLREALKASGAEIEDVHGVLLTHIHLDHAGATGAIVRAVPQIEVYVHSRGARHMAHPERLLASARRIYGGRMEALWGDFLSIPSTNLRVLQGGERLSFGGRYIRVAYPPGHASHHVCYLDETTGIAFVGDVAGMCVMGTGYLAPVAPPPDIDVEAWRRSLTTVRSWSPERLFLTHFGPSPTDLLNHAEERLNEWAMAVHASLQTGEEDAICAARFHRQEMTHAYGRLREEDRIPYEYMGQPKESWYGLARYWRKRQAMQEN